MQSLAAELWGGQEAIGATPLLLLRPVFPHEMLPFVPH